jgi:hypothetical protein
VNGFLRRLLRVRGDGVTFSPTHLPSPLIISSKIHSPTKAREIVYPIAGFLSVHIRFHGL